MQSTFFVLLLLISILPISFVAYGAVEYFRDVSQSLGLTSGVGRLIEIAKSVSQSLNFGVLGYKIQEFIASTSLGIILLIHVTNFEPAFGGIPPMFVILVGFMVILVLIVRRR